MKNLRYLIFTAIVIFVLSTSCEDMFGDFLDKAPGVDINEDSLFMSKLQVEQLVVGLYAQGAFGEFEEDPGDPRYHGGGAYDMITDAATDLGQAMAGWFWTTGWHSGNITANSNKDKRGNMRWYAIRRANVIIERIDEVPDADQAYKDQVRAEALVIRAYNNFLTFRTYGGIPIVDKRLVIGDELHIPRSSVAETVQFIVDDCNAAIPHLPDKYPSNFYGRATKGAALALKARVLLYAASPLFNTGTPYLDLPGHNELICYGNYDSKRWQIAADAAKACLDWAPSGGISLITDKGTPLNNYKAIWNEYANSESIWNSSSLAPDSYGVPPYWYLHPGVFYGGLSGVSVPLNFVKFYRKSDGSEQVWNVEGGNNLNQIYDDMEPRFKATFGYNLSYWNVDHPVVELWQPDPANGVPGGKHLNSCIYGTWMRKPIPESLSYTSPTTWPMESLFRLGEIYLYYAEALNEAQGPVPEAYAAINAIRNRGGLPNLTTGLTKEQFRAEVRREFSIEMSYENHRLWNVRRWLIAQDEGVMTGEMWGITVNRIPDTTPAEYRYTPLKVSDRIFLTRMYLHPWSQSEMNKGYLIQNPGY